MISSPKENSILFRYPKQTGLSFIPSNCHGPCLSNTLSSSFLTCSSLIFSCSSYGNERKVQPPQLPKCGQGLPHSSEEDSSTFSNLPSAFPLRTLFTAHCTRCPGSAFFTTQMPSSVSTIPLFGKSTRCTIPSMICPFFMPSSNVSFTLFFKKSGMLYTPRLSFIYPLQFSDQLTVRYARSGSPPDQLTLRPFFTKQTAQYCKYLPKSSRTVRFHFITLCQRL